jgi:hypothetical protein
MTADNILSLTGPAVLVPIPKGTKGPKLKGWQKLSLADMTQSLSPDSITGTISVFYLALLHGGSALLTRTPIRDWNSCWKPIPLSGSH